MDRNLSSLEDSPENLLEPVMELLQGGDPNAICAQHGITRDELDKRLSAYQASRRRFALADDFTVRKVGRNDPCPCKSGKKYKKCCLQKHEEVRRSLPPDQLQEMEERTKLREKLEKEVAKGLDLLFSQDFAKAQRFALLTLTSYPEDDRLHDMVVTTSLALGDYEGAFRTSRQRWQIAQEEKAFFQENGYHKREGVDRKQPVHFYAPSTWLEKLWIAQKSRSYLQMFPREENSRLAKMVDKLKIADDMQRFPGRQEEAYKTRQQALAPVLNQIETEGTAAIPYLLPLTYTFSWASLFVPQLLHACGNNECIRLLAELSMFRFPYFAQKCLEYLIAFGDRAVAPIKQIIEEDPVFDELKVGLIAVLGNIHSPESFGILARVADHENPYVVNWAIQALERHQNPEALPYLERAKERMEALSKIAGAIRDVAGKELTDHKNR